jgi:hypothetical protein
LKIRAVTLNNRKREFLITTYSGANYAFPYAKCNPVPSPEDRIEEVIVDRELGREAITFRLESGREGSVHIEQVLEFHQDPKYLADILTYKLTVEALERVEASGLSRRRIASHLNTSLPQLYRLLDPANTRKSLNQMVALLHVLNCDVDLMVTDRDAA